MSRGLRVVLIFAVWRLVLAAWACGVLMLSAWPVFAVEDKDKESGWRYASRETIMQMIQEADERNRERVRMIEEAIMAKRLNPESLDPQDRILFEIYRTRLPRFFDLTARDGHVRSPHSGEPHRADVIEKYSTNPFDIGQRVPDVTDGEMPKNTQNVTLTVRREINNELVPNASLIILDRHGRYVTRLSANRDGEAIVSLRPGPYEIIVNCFILSTRYVALIEVQVDPSTQVVELKLPEGVPLTLMGRLPGGQMANFVNGSLYYRSLWLGDLSSGSEIRVGVNLLDSDLRLRDGLVRSGGRFYGVAIARILAATSIVDVQPMAAVEVGSDVWGGCNSQVSFLVPHRFGDRQWYVGRPADRIRCKFRPSTGSYLPREVDLSLDSPIVRPSLNFIDGAEIQLRVNDDRSTVNYLNYGYQYRYGYYSTWAQVGNDGLFRLVVPRDVKIGLRTFDHNWDRFAMGLDVVGQFSGGERLEARTRRFSKLTVNVTGELLTGLIGNSVDVIAVRSDGYRALARVSGGTGGGAATIYLPSGRYTLKAIYEGRAWWERNGKSLAASDPIVVEHGEGETIVREPLHLVWATGRLVVERPSGCGSSANVRVAAVRLFRPDGALVAAWREDARQARYEHIYPGRWVVEVEEPGYPTWRQEVTVPEPPGEARVVVGWGETACSVWTGHLRGEDGRASPGWLYITDRDTGLLATWARVADDGRFNIPINENSLIRFEPRDVTRPVNFRIMGKRRPSFHEDWVISSGIPLRPLERRSGAQLLYGDASDLTRFNLVFFGDGYVADREPFQDRNGNGQWDGIVYVDLNGNGVWDRGEPWQSYGTYRTPVEGQDPTQENEPFEDINGDGYPNFDDFAVYEQNIRDHVLSLFGSHFFREVISKANIWAYWTPSRQAGTSVLDQDGVLRIFRDTYFGNYVEKGRWILDLMRKEKVFDVLYRDFSRPEFRFVLLNQPVLMGRPTSFKLGYGGTVVSQRTSYIPAHEFGHSYGNLADEYDEFGSNGPEAIFVAPNLSAYADPELVPWDVIRPGPYPNAAGLPGQGVFEGGGLVRGSVYRPASRSIMEGLGSPAVFNEASIRALSDRACAFNGYCDLHLEVKNKIWWRPDEAGWGLFLVDQGSAVIGGWFTNDLAGRPMWYLVVGRPAFGTQKPSTTVDVEIWKYRGTHFADFRPGSPVQGELAGRGRLIRDKQDQLVFEYLVEGITGRKVLVGYEFGWREAKCELNGSVSPEDAMWINDVWWKADESGWGLFLEQRDNRLFGSWFTYAEGGWPIFYVLELTGDSVAFSGKVYRPRPGLGLAQIDGRPARSGVDEVGQVELRFENSAVGLMRANVEGRVFEKRIERFKGGRFSPSCGPGRVRV